MNIYVLNISDTVIFIFLTYLLDLRVMTTYILHNPSHTECQILIIIILYILINIKIY
jgi:hypothetical protein